MNPEPPLAVPPAHPRLDEAALARLRELDPDGRHGVLRRVLGAFETSLVRMLAQLAAELEDGSPTVVATVAHTLKSSAASVGALDLARTCEDIERRLRAGAVQPLRPEVEHLTAQGEAALVAVRAMLLS